MPVIKQKFKLKKRKISVFMIFTIALLMIFSAVFGFWLSDSGIIDKQLNRSSSQCVEMYKAMQDFMKEANYWRNADQECEKKLWACQFLLKQRNARINASNPADVDS